MPVELEEYREFAPKGAVDFLYRLSEQVKGRRFLHVSAVRFGGGSAEVLRRIVPIMKSLGVDANWEVIAGVQEFFDVTKRVNNALQGQGQEPSDDMYKVYLQVNQRNAQALNLEGDLVMVHDPQPAALVEHKKDGKWV